MMKFDRPPQPSFLAENYKQWGREFKARRDQNPSATFQWRTYQGTKVNELLVQVLAPVAQDHCAFCDGYPLGTFARQTLEHFRPKSEYPRLVYVWGNLFVCCDQCQASKAGKFDRTLLSKLYRKLLLKPDCDDYSFERYFIVNYRTGEIEANPANNDRDRVRAEFTIEIYGLNRYGRPQSRLNEYRKFQNLQGKGYSLNDFSYRYFME